MAGRENNIDVNAEEYQALFKWMTQKFQDMGVGDVPNFPMNSSLLAEFIKLKNANEEADKIVERNLKKAEEFEKELLEREHDFDLVLDAMKIRPEQLSSEGKRDLNTLVTFQQARGLDSSDDYEATKENLKLAVLNLNSKIAKANMLHNEGYHKLQKLQRLNSELQQYCDNFERFLKEEKETEGESKSTLELLQQQIKVLNTEKESLAKEYDTLSKDLPALKENETTANQVEALLVQIEEEKKKSAELQSRLDEYQDLPPDIKLAKSVLLNKNKELKEFKAEITFLVSSMDGAGFS